jgi:hypothetical protein
MIPLRACLVLLCVAATQDVSPADVDTILKRADGMFEEAKKGYDDARTANSVQGFVEAGFKLEEARFKYLVVQEIGSADNKKAAGDRLRSVQQLGKLIRESRLAISGAPAALVAAPSSEKPDAPAPKPIAPATPPTKPAADLLVRLPVPEAAVQKEAEKSIKDLFKAEYAKKTAADRQALAVALLDKAGRVGDDAGGLWVLYREAQDVAVLAGDAKTAMLAVDAAAQRFDIDAFAMKSVALAAIGKAAKSTDEISQLIDAMNRLIDELIASDVYEAADKTAAAAVGLAKRSAQPMLVQKTAMRAKEVSEAKSKFQSMKGSLETLAKSPDDPRANGEMGQFLCFVKSNWDMGLRFLAKGPDGPFKSLSAKEMAAPTGAAELVAIADEWCSLAEKDKSPLKRTPMLAHASTIYEQALPDSSGVLKAKIEKRLGELDPALLAGGVDLIALIDLKKDTRQGMWQKDGRALVNAAANEYDRIQIPYIPPDEYDVQATIVRRSGDQSIVLGLARGNSQWGPNFDFYHGGMLKSGVERMDGKQPEFNSLVYTGGRVFYVGKRVQMEAQVRKTGFKITADGKTIFSYAGDYKNLDMSGGWSMPDTKLLWLGLWKGEVAFERLVLIPVSGQGKKLR